MLRDIFHFIMQWLLVALFIFLACAAVITILIVGAMFITWSLPEIPSLTEFLFSVRVLLAFSIFVGFCLTATPW
ncbi:cell division protein FtsK [Escherichia coli]